MTPPATMDVQFANQQTLAPIDEGRLRALCERTMAGHGIDADLSVVLGDNALIRDLNARFRSEDEITDVLAFPFDDEPGPDGERLLGEIVVSVEKAMHEAAERGGAAEAETALYVAHGLLHLLGYDDHDPDDVRRMREAEAHALADAGFAPTP
ncbi:rRNA maturation RNase YbeY [bacterium]|nr:rRNA maturation RNase YbeY [bacterium]